MSTVGDSETDSSRIGFLARPRQFTSLFKDDKPSVYWTDYEPFHTGPDGFTVITASPRVKELSMPKHLHPLFQLPRSTIWPVRESTMHADPTERIISLGHARPVHPDYKYLRPNYMFVTPGAQHATASARVTTLSTPKNREDKFGIKEKAWGQFFPISKEAMNCQERPHTSLLAAPKPYHQNFRPERPIPWTVDESALKAIAPLRLQQLSRPRSRTLIKDDYDPYHLSNAAKKARASDRTEELSQPNPRKVRAKKQG